jgi:hypothetical protein
MEDVKMAKEPAQQNNDPEPAQPIVGAFTKAQQMPGNVLYSYHGMPEHQ